MGVKPIVQSHSHVQLFVIPRTAACQAFLSFTVSWSLLKLMSIESKIPSNHLFFCHPLLLLPSILSSIRVFSSESVLHIRWPKYWSFSFSISPSYEYSGLIFFRIDWFDLLDVQGTLKTPFQHHSSKAWVLWYSAFFIVQLSHPYMTTGKTMALIRHYFANKGPYSQSCGFPSSHVQMWELDNKICWVLKNWCVQTVGLKTLGNPLDCKEIKPVNPKGN